MFGARKLMSHLVKFSIWELQRQLRGLDVKGAYARLGTLEQVCAPLHGNVTFL